MAPWWEPAGMHFDQSLPLRGGCCCTTTTSWSPTTRRVGSAAAALTLLLQENDGIHHDQTFRVAIQQEDLLLRFLHDDVWAVVAK